MRQHSEHISIFGNNGIPIIAISNPSLISFNFSGLQLERWTSGSCQCNSRGVTCTARSWNVAQCPTFALSRSAYSDTASMIVRCSEFGTYLHPAHNHIASRALRMGQSKWVHLSIVYPGCFKYLLCTEPVSRRVSAHEEMVGHRWKMKTQHGRSS